ncbi:hypothetical protein [Bradyrhizobium sp. 153]|uniref:hypothetical protein n=1 Tax=Bradyrhizobium sp. 153 TaxID=2782627 RepID=UPI001FF85C7C|nr:hypothetical protein [Bradyrhizobium sp. 153]MCK1668624.1 hypothetical protein [Bradyrhizobium sp. 153]
MTDPREKILARLFDVLTTAAEAAGGHAFRNVAKVPEHKMPAIRLFDGDEATDEAAFGRGRPASGPLIVAATPEIFVTLANDTEALGTEINTWRAKVIKAVLTDATLLELCHNGDVRYLGCSTALGEGREMTGDLGLAFALNYALRPAQLP